MGISKTLGSWFAGLALACGASTRDPALTEEDFARAQVRQDALAPLPIDPERLATAGPPFLRVELAMGPWGDWQLDDSLVPILGRRLERLGVHAERLVLVPEKNQILAVLSSVREDRLGAVAAVLRDPGHVALGRLPPDFDVNELQSPKGRRAISWHAAPVADIQVRAGMDGMSRTNYLLTSEGAAAAASLTATPGRVAVLLDDFYKASWNAREPSSGVIGLAESGDTNLAHVVPTLAPLPRGLFGKDQARAVTPPCEGSTCVARCAAADGPACMAAARTSEGAARDQLLRSACRHGVDQACVLACEEPSPLASCRAAADLRLGAALLYIDPGVATALLARLCRRGDLAACSEAGEHLLGRWTDGTDQYPTVDALWAASATGPRADEVLAARQALVTRARMACTGVELGDRRTFTPCLFAAKAYRVGDVVARDLDAEAVLFTRAAEHLRVYARSRRRGP